MFHTRTLVAYLVVQFGGMESYTEKTPDSAVCNSREESSVIRFAHSIKKFTDVRFSTFERDIDHQISLT